MSTYRIRIKLKDFKHSHIERIFEADGNCTFFQLHDAICQTMWFEWYHLWDFEKRKWSSIVCIIQSPYWFSNDQDLRGRSLWSWTSNQKFSQHDSTITTLDQIFAQYRSLLYCYDYGDNRKFDVNVTTWSSILATWELICVASKWWLLIENCWGTDWLQEWIWLYENNKRDKEAFDSKVEFVAYLQPYLHPYRIQPLQDYRKHLKLIESMIKKEKYQ